MSRMRLAPHVRFLASYVGEVKDELDGEWA